MSYGMSFAIDSYNDLCFDPNKNTIILSKGVDNCKQALIILLKTLKGENKFYPEFGVDIPQLLERNISEDNIKHAIRDAIIRDPRVKTIDKIEINRDNSARSLSIYIHVTTFDGAVLEFKQDAVW